MDFNKNRLQFVHCDELFATSDEAKKYVSGQLDQIDRPSLYGEPMILKYGSAENPNIILAIGSVGDGKNINIANRTFFIDSAKIESDIKDIQDSVAEKDEVVNDLKGIVESIINACGLTEDGKYNPNTDDAILKNAESLYKADKLLSEYIKSLENKTALNIENTDTLSLNLEKDENGMILKGDVKLPKNKIFDDKVISNIIIKDENGIFSNVDVDYNDEGELVFSVNGIEKKMPLPQDTHVIEGKYDETKESIVLTFNKEIETIDENGSKKTSNKLEINLGKLIEEWTVMGENSKTPVMLFREKVDSEDEVHGLYKWQDVLSADIRVANEKQVPTNILKKDETGRYLYVDGSASNITYWKDGEKISVQKAIDSLQTSVSESNGNIISTRNDGIYATTDLTYNDGTNTLYFSVSNTKGEIVNREIKLNGIEFFQDVYYDQASEKIIILYKDASGVVKKLEIPVRDLINEWEVDNSNSTVTLKRTEVTAGTDKLSANVNVATNSKNNILEVQNNHSLYVRGEADNIKFGDNSTVNTELVKIEGDSDTIGSIKYFVKQESDARIASDKDLQSNITAEVERAKGEEARIEAKITAQTTSTNDEIKRIEGKLDDEIKRSTTADEHIISSLTKNEKAINDEIARATEAESALDVRVTENKSAIDVEVIRAKGEEKRIEDKFDNKISALETADTTIKETLNEVKSSLQVEVARATAAEKDLDSKISENSTLIHDNTVSIGTLETKVEQHLTASTEVHKQLADKVNEIDGKVGTLETKVETNTRDIASESNRAQAVEELLSASTISNTNAINAEVGRATSAEAELRQSISDAERNLSFTTSNSKTLVLKKSESTSGGYVLEGDVLVSSNVGNLLNSNGEALYASVDLTYDEGKNTLRFVTSDGTDKTLQLNAGSIITSIDYDATNEQLIIRYEDAQGVEQTTYVPVRDLFNEWDVQENHLGAVILTKEKNTSGPDILSAEVVIANPSTGTNLLENVQGALFVPNRASGIILGNGTNVQVAIDNIKNDITNEINNRIEGDKHLQNQIDILSGKTNGYDVTIEELKKNDISQQTQIDVIKEDVKTIISNDKVQDANIAELSLKVTNIQTDITNINTKIDEIEAKNDDQDAAIKENQDDINNLEQKTNIVAIDSYSVDLEYNSTINSSSLKADVKISDDSLNLISVVSNEPIDSTNNGLLFNGSVDYGTFVQNLARHLQFKRNDGATIFANREEAKAYLNSTVTPNIVDGEIVMARYLDKLGKICVLVGYSVISGNDKFIYMVDATELIEYINAIIKAVGLNQDGSYTAPTGITNTYISASTSVVDALSNLSEELVDRLKIDAISDTNSVHLSVDKETQPLTPTLKADVILADTSGQPSASENVNILQERTDGLFANVHLGYDAIKNTLKVNVGTDAYDVQLNQGSLVNKIEYDKTTEEIVFTYTNAQSVQTTFRVPVKDLIEEYVYPNSKRTEDLYKGEGNVLFSVVRNTNGTSSIYADIDVFDCGTY